MLACACHATRGSTHVEGGGLPPDEIPLKSGIRVYCNPCGQFCGRRVDRLFTGVQLNWIKGPLAVGISFTVNDIMLKWLSESESADDIE